MKLLKHFLLLILAGFLMTGCAEKQKSEYFVFLNTNPDMEELSAAEAESLREKHLDNMEKFAAAGDMVASGSFEDGGEMMILKAASMEKALEMVNTDPSVQAGRFTVEVLPVSFIKGEICPWWVPVNMETYGVFRFRQGTNKNAERLQDHFYRLSVLEDEPSVLVQADFDDAGSGILLLDQPLSDEWIEKIIDNQAIQEGVIEVDIKTLLIAHGTFCD